MPAKLAITILLFGWNQLLQAQLDKSQKSKPPPIDEVWIIHKDSAILDSVRAIAPKFALDENISIDCVWITQYPYFGTWTSEKVNPYELDAAKFADTITVSINDSLAIKDWAFPITKTRITSPFGFRRYRWHYGTDLKLYHGDTVVAAFDGVVRIVDYERYGYGRYVLLRHLNGLETLYGHLSKVKVKVGQTVKAGELIGLGGSTGRSTGSHLHFEVRYQGNAIDPSSIYDFTSDSLKSNYFTITPSTFAYIKEARKRRFHRIRRGDTLGHISQRYGVSISRLCRLNGISRKTILRIGRRLRIG